MRLAALALRSALRLSRRQAGIVLVYHALAETAGDPDRELVPAHDVDRFEAHLRHLGSCYQVVRLQDLRAAVERRRRGARFPVAITFDDDLLSHVELAAPLLERHRAHAIFFLCGASLARPHAFWFQRLQRAVDQGHVLPLGGGSIHEIAARIEVMTPDERAGIEEQLAAGDDPGLDEHGLRSEDVRGLVDRGFDVGFHTVRHDRLTALDDLLLRRALTEGRRELEQAAGRTLDVIAYPHGKADDRVAAAAKAAGFQLGVTGRYEPVVPSSDPLLLGRIEPTYASDAHFASQLARLLVRGSHA
ncbi:MAG: polysaccharide deacetylase family protein [Gaiellaceae bacterium]